MRRGQRKGRGERGEGGGGGVGKEMVGGCKRNRRGERGEGWRAREGWGGEWVEEIGVRGVCTCNTIVQIDLILLPAF